ncbi:hypothetical protein BDA96_03G096700 [Sorghum bicolor]|uniref:Uncharacterized protein n=2 Tax=Sorghum bicolor TaxID=4558 RepID=A0A921RBT1_SORBI|nr:hypothetical protein BDA96_03G096700 [Sorghum bicolor]OQU86451.1 hypothetical protein SORBI_3003G092033 [Sorghum bicolor]
MMKPTLLLPQRATTSCSTPASTFTSTSSLSMPSSRPLDTKKVDIKEHMPPSITSADWNSRWRVLIG